MSIRSPLWELTGITKRFSGVAVNRKIDLCLYPGEIHGLLGENGSGKSTLIKTLSGTHQPDEGQLLREGKPVRLTSPVDAREKGVATVFQEFSLIGSLSVAENIHLGAIPIRRGCVQWNQMREAARRVLKSMALDIDVDAEVGTLPVAHQQLIEIAKALVADASLIILDEPTTALSIDEIDKLHGLLKKLKSERRAILYISHRLDEVVSLVDTITILKDGEVVSDAATSRVEIPYIVNAMVGDVGEHYPKKPQAFGDTLLEVRSISTRNKVSDVSFELHRGEVFGLGGVLGSGRTEIARALFGLDRLTSGEIVLDGKRLDLRSPQDSIKAGIALVPENRKTDGLFFNFSGFPNITTASLRKLGRWGRISLAAERDQSLPLIHDLEVSPSAEYRPVGFLSGGNQQKLVIARWLHAEADVFILDEPTQGIDIGAKIAVYQLINRLTEARKSVILISSDYDELVSMSDRIGIVRQGQLVSTVPASTLRQGEQRGVWAEMPSTKSAEISIS